MVRGERKVVLELPSNANWHMNNKISLINSCVLSCTLCVTDTEMLGCQEGRQVCDRWVDVLQCWKRSDISLKTSLCFLCWHSQAQQSGDKRHPDGRELQNANSAAKAASGRADWGVISANYRGASLLHCPFLIWKALRDFPTSQEEATLPPCNWHWPSKTTCQGSRHRLAVLGLHRHLEFGCLRAGPPSERLSPASAKLCCLNSERSNIKTPQPRFGVWFSLKQAVQQAPRPAGRMCKASQLARGIPPHRSCIFVVTFYAFPYV